MTRPGTLCRPTRVAAMSCHDASPLFSHSGEASVGRRLAGSDMFLFYVSFLGFVIISEMIFLFLFEEGVRNVIVVREKV